MIPTHVVKIARTGWESVIYSGSLSACQVRAAGLNRQYRTDEYYVEPFDAERLSASWPSP